MADKRISQLVERVDIANNDVVPIVASGATTTNKATISSIQTFMQENLDVGVTSVGITIGTSGTDVSVTGSPVTTSGNITINIPTASATNRGLLSAADWTTFNNKQDAGSFVTLDTAQTITAQKTFTTSGSSDTMIISHGSGSGFALDVLKAGNNEALRVTKTSGSGNAMTVIGGNFEAPTIVKTGGTSTQFLKADGSVDSSTYLTTGSATSTYVPYSGAAASVNLGVYSITANAINSAGSGSTAGQINLRSDAFFSLVNGYGSIASGTTNQFNLYQTTGAGVFRGAILSLNSITESATRTYTLPNADGTLALSTDLGAYLPLTGGTLTGALNGTSASFSGVVGIGTPSPSKSLEIISNVSQDGIKISGSSNPRLTIIDTTNNVQFDALVTDTEAVIRTDTNHPLVLSTNGTPRLTIASTGAATFTGALNGTSATFTAAVIPMIFKGTNAGTMFTEYYYNTNTLSGSIGSGSGLLSGANASDFIVRSEADFVVATGGNNRRLTLSSTGAATFSSSVTLTSGLLSVDGFANKDTNYITLRSGFSPSDSGGIGLKAIDHSGSGTDGLACYGHDGISLYTAQTERMRITSGGNVGIGTASPNFSSYGAGITVLSLATSTADKFSVLELAGNRGSGGNQNAQIDFVNNNGTATVTSRITALNGASVLDGELTFHTRTSAGSLTERMRITSGGYLKQSYDGTYLGATSAYNEFTNNASGEPGIITTIKGASISDASVYLASFETDHNNSTAQFFRGRGNVETRVRIYSNGGIANYQANDVNLSDERTKKDIEPLESYWDKFKAIEIVKFKYKDQTHDDFNIGVIAQQVEAVAPEFVDVDGWDTKPKLDEEGNEIVSTEEPLKSIYTADLHHATIKVLQEAMAKIEKLETEIDSLKNQIK